MRRSIRAEGRAAHASSLCIICVVLGVVHNVVLLQRPKDHRDKKRKHSELSSAFTSKQMKVRGRPCLKAKASETKHALPFFVAELGEAISRGLKVSRGAPMHKAGELLLQQYAMLSAKSADDRRMSDGKEYLRFSCSFLRLYRRGQGHPTIKNHYDVHLAEQTLSCGHPGFYHTYVDESFNRTAKRWAQKVHLSRFALRVPSRAKVNRVQHKLVAK